MGRGRDEHTCDIVDSVVDDEIHALLTTVVGSNICGGELLRHGDARGVAVPMDGKGW